MYMAALIKSSNAKRANAEATNHTSRNCHTGNQEKWKIKRRHWHVVQKWSDQRKAHLLELTVDGNDMENVMLTQISESVLKWKW